MRNLRSHLALAAFFVSALGSAQTYYAIYLQKIGQSVPWSIYTDTAGNSTLAGNAGGQDIAYFWPSLTAAPIKISTGSGRPNTNDRAYAAGQGVQGGYTSVPGPHPGPDVHAAIWHSVPGSVVDLQPGYTSAFSVVNGIDPFNPDLQVGVAGTRATIWRSTAVSAQDIHPPDAHYFFGGSRTDYSYCNSASQGYICGGGLFPGSGGGRTAEYHALLWDKDTLVARDIHSYDYVFTDGLCNDGQVVVGSGTTNDFLFHALLWTDPSLPPIDLTPDASYAYAYGVRNGVVVGVKDGHAAAWVGPDHHFIDLSAILGDRGEARSVDQLGNIVGFGYGGSHAYPVLWTLNPPNQSPVAVAGPDQTVEATGAATPVTLDGSGSSDPDLGDQITYRWSDSSNQILGTNAALQISQPLGSVTYTLTVTDSHGLASSSMTHVTVQDTAAPSISAVTASETSIWPPDHKMHPVTISYSFADADPNASASLSVVTNGAGKDPAWTVVDAHHVLLKAEPGLKSRTLVYTVIVTALDSAGNVSYRSVDIRVDH